VTFEFDDFEYLRILVVGVQFVVFMVFKLYTPSKFNESCILGCNYVYMMWLSGHATIAGLCICVCSYELYVVCVCKSMCTQEWCCMCVYALAQVAIVQCIHIQFSTGYRV
jgi:hypothetical protein